VALVTGAGRRVGRTIALALARAGAAVAVHYGRSAAGAAETVRQAEAEGVPACALAADLASPSAVRDVVAAAADRLGRLDVLVNSAAIFQRADLGEIDVEAWDRMHAINLRAPFLACQAAVPLMRRTGGGHIVNVADVGGLIPWAHYSHYVVAKAGLVMLTRALALELAPAIRVNAVAPGTVLWSEKATPEEKERVVSRIPLARIGTPDDVARTVLFFVCGPGFVTGQVVAIDGGRSINTGAGA
jgi:NAD(P)-dependent dehydrogenase (short-subunit alcohol dehydrogenase family)